MQISERIKDALRTKFPTADFTEYFGFLESCKVPIECALHSHHIAPQKTFPTLKKDKDNLIDVAVVDHLQAHKLLAECGPEFALASPRFIAAAAKGGQTAAASPKWKAAQTEMLRLRNDDPEFRDANSQRMKKNRANPQFSAVIENIHSERMTKVHSDPKWGEKMQEVFADPAWKARQSLHSKNLMHIRWHVKRNIVNPSCTLCNQGVIECQSQFPSRETPVPQSRS
jgi:hypothetical protein